MYSSLNPIVDHPNKGHLSIHFNGLSVFCCILSQLIVFAK